MGRRLRAGAARWRLFRHEAGRVAGPPAWAYVLLFASCQLVGLWSSQTFHATVMWPANAVLIAALLQLHRRPALGVLIACAGINLVSNIVRGDPGAFVLLNVLLNLTQVAVATVMARRYCGAALDMRRPRRLFRLFLGAAVPAVAISSLLAAALAVAFHRVPLGGLPFRVHHLFDMELLAMMIVTPTLLLLARNHRFRADAVARWQETAALVGLVGAVTAWVFAQNAAPVLFLVLPPLVLLAFRLSPPWTAATVILISVIGGFATVTGHGPVTLTQVTPDPALANVPDVMRRMGVLHLFLLALVATALPITTLSSERRRLVIRLKARTAAAVAALKRAEEADAAKSRFLALMSHEMRTPLTGVSGYSDLLSRAPELSTESRRQINAIRQCGDTMLHLVEDLLELSRGGDEVTLARTDIRRMVEDAVATARDRALGRGLDFEVTFGAEAEVCAVTDARRLGQALHHVVNNAVKFTEAGRVHIAVERDGDALRFTVSDTGCGMSPTVLAGVFDLFEQADASTARLHEGAGVGLALSRAHVERLGGQITAASVEGCGSTFVLEAPAVAAESQEPSAEAAGDDTPLRVLIVDDHPANRDLLRIMMQAGGCETEEATDGAQAVAAVAERVFDIILMDVRMPGIDGIQATRAIRASAGPMRDVPILAVTADAMPEDAARCLAAGMDHHLAKPVTQAKLYDAVDQTLERAAERLAAAA